MKRFFLGLICLLSIVLMQAQEAEAKHISDKDRVALTPIVEDDNIPANAHKQLINKMTQIAAKNGCAATSDSRFVITCSADVLTKDITPTAAVAFLQDRCPQMAGIDIGMAFLAAEANGVFQHLFDPWGQFQLAGRVGTFTGQLDHLLPDRFRRHGVGKVGNVPRSFTDQGDQHMLRPHIFAVQLERGLLGASDDFLRAFVESAENGHVLPPQQ